MNIHITAKCIFYFVKYQPFVPSSLRHNNIFHRPTPSIDEIETAAHSFCSLDWTTAESSMYDKHPYTANAQIAHRCVEGLYIATLLEYGFGFKGSSRNITLALDVSL